MPKSITLAVTGASGMPYVVALLRELLSREDILVNFIISKAGIVTMHQELNISLAQNPQLTREKLLESIDIKATDKFNVYGIEDWYAPVASGSSVADVTIVCPCTMATLAKIANGIGDDLIARAADVCLKERKNLILVPRETPFSAIHLENMLKLAQLGVSIIPPIPAFYTHPATIDDMVNFVVSRILDQAGIGNSLINRW